MPFFGHIFEQNFGHIFGPSQGDVVILFLVNPFNPVPLFDDPKFSDEVFSHFKELRFFMIIIITAHLKCFADYQYSNLLFIQTLHRIFGENFKNWENITVHIK